MVKLTLSNELAGVNSPQFADTSMPLVGALRRLTRKLNNGLHFFFSFGHETWSARTKVNLIMLISVPSFPIYMYVYFW